MKKSTCLLTLLALPASGQLVITEVMPSSSHSDTGANGDWFEITNSGGSAVNLSGYSWDDDSEVSGVQIFPNYSLNPGQSALVLGEDNSGLFETLWSLSDTKIFLRTEFANFPGLGAGGDGVFLYNPGGNLVDSFVYTAATSGVTFARFTNGDEVPGGLSSDGQFGATTSSGGDVASPGTAAVLPPASPPIFIEPFDPAWVGGVNISNSSLQIVAADPNPGDTITLTVLSKPDWLTVSDQGDGTATLSGTPGTGDIGTTDLIMQAEDDSGETDPATQTYKLSIAPATSPIILNEYNGVAPENFLNGGDEDEADGAVDSKLGRIQGNGGAWLEFVVTGSGGGNTVVDLRGWTITIDSEESTRILHLSDHIALASIPAGTILTFIEDSAVTDLGLNLISRYSTAGFGWSNIWMHNAILIDQSKSTHPDVPAIGSRNTRVTITAPDEATVYGPSGESVASRDSSGDGHPDELIALGSVDVLKLEENPTQNVNPLYGEYDDGSTSTFSQPNIWASGATTQSFLAFRSQNTPPVFGAIPFQKSSHGEYDEVVSISDPLGKTLTITAPALPDFLTLTEEVGRIRLVNNRPLTFADIGSYEITIQADNGGAAPNLAFLVYQLEVLNPAPAVIVNEYNAVSDENFLNGGTLGADSDGLPAARDSHFGRVQGNGGDWFELVVVGDGEPGATKLTGWKIAVGTSPSGGSFSARTTIELSDPQTWDTVSNGTILTFIDRNTAGGGLDTEINRVDELTGSGYAWSNIYLGSNLVSGDQLTELEIDSNNTQIVIYDASGIVIFGPAGEGIAPPDGVGSTEIFELENDPSPLVSSIDLSSDTQNGYDDGSSSSTFGSPNLFTPFDVALERDQIFTAFTQSPFLNWLVEAGIPSEGPEEDNDLDQATNLEEYLFGGDPTDRSSSPIVTLDASAGTTTYDVRTNDPAYNPVGQRSADLRSWTSDGLSSSDEASPLGPEYARRSYLYEGEDPRMFFRIYQP